MKILIKELYGDKGFEYSKQCEQCLGDILKNSYGIICEGYTEGYNPDYDFIADGSKIEVKFTSKVHPNIEFARYNKNPSGLLLSKSDYYLVVSPGGSKGKFVGKIRLYETNDLKAYLVDCLMNQDDLVKYEPSGNSPGSICFKLEPKKIEDIWLGDCDLIIDEGKVAGFDLDTFKKSNVRFNL